MPIIYIHGVATRQTDADYDDHLAQIRLLLKHYIAPQIAPDADRVAIIPVYWGDYGVQFAWHGRSRPRTPLLGMGVETHAQEDSLDVESLRVADMRPYGLSSMLQHLIDQRTDMTPDEKVHQRIAILAACEDERMRTASDHTRSMDAEIDLLGDLIDQYRTATQPATLIEMGAGESSRDLARRAVAMTRWMMQMLRYGLSALPSEVVRPQTHWILPLIGDVFVYLERRGEDTAGAIPNMLITCLRQARDNQLARNGEPIILLSHSMGGQIVYDVLTHYLPALPSAADIRVDFWAAAASQVGLFEEMKLFKCSDARYSAATGRLVPPPDHQMLGYWWNTWDHHDPLSFSVTGIFATQPTSPTGVDDEYFPTYEWIGNNAHGNHLLHPEFYRRFAAKIAQAQLHQRRR